MNRSRITGRLFTSLLLLFVLTISVYAESSSKSTGGFSISPPPLGYANYYGVTTPKRHRVDIAYQYIDIDVSEVQGGSVYANSRILTGSWGSVSLQYGGFYLFGDDKGAENGADVDLTVSGFNVAPTAEVLLYRSSDEAGHGFLVTSFFGVDGGFQFFTQDFSTGEESYYSRFAGPLAGIQAHIPAGKILVSPFFTGKYLMGESVSDYGDFTFDFTAIGYGFDIVWSTISLSGIIQAATESEDTTYTISLGFAF